MKKERALGYWGFGERVRQIGRERSAKLAEVRRKILLGLELRLRKDGLLSDREDIVTLKSRIKINTMTPRN